MKLLGLFVSLLVFGSCSSLQKVNSSKRNLDFSLIEQVDFGETTGEEVAKLIGQPTQVIHLQRGLLGKDAWIYFENKGDQKFERLGLLVDQKTGIAQSVTWSVREGESLHLKEFALSYFKNAKFTATQAGRVARDYYSDDWTYIDQQIGVSLSVDSVRQTVRSITLEASPQRKLAKNQK